MILHIFGWHYFKTSRIQHPLPITSWLWECEAVNSYYIIKEDTALICCQNNVHPLNIPYRNEKPLWGGVNGVLRYILMVSFYCIIQDSVSRCLNNILKLLNFLGCKWTKRSVSWKWITHLLLYVVDSNEKGLDLIISAENILQILQIQWMVGMAAYRDACLNSIVTFRWLPKWVFPLTSLCHRPVPTVLESNLVTDRSVRF